MKSERRVRQSTRGEIGHDQALNSLQEEADEYQKTAAMTVLRRGLKVSPELRSGAVITVLMALIVASGSLAIPILIQQILDKGLAGTEGLDSGFIYSSWVRKISFASREDGYVV